MIDLDWISYRHGKYKIIGKHIIVFSTGYYPMVPTGISIESVYCIHEYVTSERPIPINGNIVKFRYEARIK